MEEWIGGAGGEMEEEEENKEKTTFGKSGVNSVGKRSER